jgi:purine-nucleoside phosphorylase
MIDLNFKYKELIDSISKDKPFVPELALTLGSGLGDFANKVTLHKTISTSELIGYPPSTIQGHEGKIHFAEFAGKKILLFQGRIHYYEGYPLSECILPVFISFKLGCKKMFLTNAAGGINSIFIPGDLMLAVSFNGINIKKELTGLVGISSLKGKSNFFDFPSTSFNNLIRKSALEEKINLKEGVYWYTKGPSYETPAEIKMIKMFGGDAVGMSTVHEAVFSAYLGMETSSVSCITNFAAGITNKKLNHAEVTKTANRVKEKFERLVKRIISNI